MQRQNYEKEIKSFHLKGSISKSVIGEGFGK